MLPVVDKPLIQYAVDEARAAGIEQFCMITGRGKMALVEHFDVAYELESTLRQRGKEAELEMLRNAQLAPGDIVTVRQQVPLGLGHAIWCARAFIGDDPFGILLPDDLVLSDTPCMKQLADAYYETGGSVVAIEEVPPDKTHKYGILKIGTDDGRLVEVDRAGRKAETRGCAFESFHHRPLRADARRDHPSRAHGTRRRQRGAAHRRHGAHDRGHPLSTACATRAHVSIAATRSDFWRHRSPSPCSGRKWQHR